MNFVLHPFTPSDKYLHGRVEREGTHLHLTWQGLAPAPPIAPPERLDDLWQATCYEFFLASPDHPGYWEFNLAPCGNWNIYHLDSYRSGLREEPALAAFPFTILGDALSTTLDLAGLPIAHAPWQLAIAVVEADVTVTYWALAHPGAEADFHLADSFQVLLP